MEPVEAFFEPVKLARKQTCLNLTIFPILRPAREAPYYLTLDEALTRGVVAITEIGNGGEVPNLKLQNHGALDILIVEGEELTGAKQNRIVNSSLLIPGKSEVLLPVSCVEAGRWHYTSPGFSTARRMMPASIRRGHNREVDLSLRRGAGHRSDQGRIWDEIAAKTERLEVDAPTAAMGEMFEQRREALAGYRRGFRPVDCQVGAVFAVNGLILGLECFGYAPTLGRFFDRLIESYALDALDWQEAEPTTAPSSAQARRFCQSAAQAPGVSYDAPGAGQNLRFSTRSLLGSALVGGGGVLHLTAFRKKGPDHTASGVRYQRFSQRRNRWTNRP